tara:strand:- start:1126 stop:2226 length:1101 start_codon:yes stop_codon:yes gene_type:complete
VLPDQYQPELCDSLFITKSSAAQALLSPFSAPQPVLFSSPPNGYRLRAEFRIWHDGDDLNYVMFPKGQRDKPQVIRQFPIAGPKITESMAPLRRCLKATPILRKKLFQAEFLSTLSGELLITLVYHCPLDEAWEAEARDLATRLGCKLIGRSRKQKIVLDDEWVDEALEVNGEQYRYRQPEQSFTQPNGPINQMMMQWLLSECEPTNTDLLELYCGIGNFTLPLAQKFRQVVATELSKKATEAAHWNAAMNNVSNVSFARLSAEDMTLALANTRHFRRLEHLPQPLSQYDFSTLLVDPPRAGLDQATLALASRFKRVFYISCNTESLRDNLTYLMPTHSIDRLAFFDQFPYTNHLESGVILKSRAL